MTDYPIVKSVDVDDKGAHIVFNTPPMQDGNHHSIAAVSVPPGHDTQHVARQLKMLATLDAMPHDHAQAVAQHIGAELYRPDPNKKAGQQQHQVHGQHTANYMEQMSAQPSQGQAI